ncbi:higA protein [Streptomyces sp. NL15-2K]|nr:higA protein [Streptomyces sp. NL15-2K]
MSTTRRSRRNASAMKMVGALLALFREAAGYTQKSLGEQFVVGEQQIASIEQGRRPLKLDLVGAAGRTPRDEGGVGDRVEQDAGGGSHSAVGGGVPGSGTGSDRDLVVREPAGPRSAPDGEVRTGGLP